MCTTLGFPSVGAGVGVLTFVMVMTAVIGEIETSDTDVLAGRMIRLVVDGAAGVRFGRRTFDLVGVGTAGGHVVGRRAQERVQAILEALHRHGNPLLLIDAGDLSDVPRARHEHLEDGRAVRQLRDLQQAEHRAHLDRRRVVGRRTDGGEVFVRGFVERTIDLLGERRLLFLLTQRGQRGLQFHVLGALVEEAELGSLLAERRHHLVDVVGQMGHRRDGRDGDQRRTRIVEVRLDAGDEGRNREMCGEGLTDLIRFGVQWTSPLCRKNKSLCTSDAFTHAKTEGIYQYRKICQVCLRVQ